MGQRASECSSVWQNGTKGGAQNSQTECLLARLARLLAIQLRLAHPNGGGRRREATEPAPLVSDKQENNAHAHLPPLRRHTNKPKEEEREGRREGGTRRETGYRGDTSFVSEWIWVQSLLLKTSSFFMHRLLGWQQWTRNRVHHTVIGCSMDVVAGRNPESSPRPQVIGRLDLSEQLGTKYLNRRWKRGRRKMRSLHSGNLIS